MPYSYYNWNYLEFNSYDKSSSLGNPVLRDRKFRYALNYAVDKQRLAPLAYQGYAQPATTIIPPGIWTNPDYHWQPPADQAYSFDLAKAGQLLTQAGYKLSSNGVRLDKKGKPIKLRLYTSTDSSQEQSEAKVITGWLEPAWAEDHPLGGRPRHAHVRHLQRPRHDLGARLRSRGVELDGLLRPRPDACLLHHTADRQPRRALLVERPVRCAERCVQASTIDPQARQTPIWQMQQLMYQQTPWVVLTYPDYLEAYNTSEVDGLAADVRRQRPGLQHRGLHRFVPEPAAQDGGGRRRTRAAPC